MRRKMSAVITLLSALVLTTMGGAGVLGACSAVSSLTTLTFDLPPKSFSFDTASSGWKAPPASFPSVTCGTSGQQVTDCCHPPAPAPEPDCAGTTPLVCESGVCVLEFPVTTSQAIDLKMEVPALSNLGGQTLAQISISQITYTIASTLNVVLPAIDVYVADQGATSSKDASAKKFGTIPATPANTTQSGDMMLDPNGQAAFSHYASSFTIPFTIIAQTTMIVPPGSPVPTGKVDVTVGGKVKAKPNL
jgi:hypothetical protein